MKTNDEIVDNFKGIDFSGFKMPLITVYRSPIDYKGKFVARLFDLNRPTNLIVVKENIDEVRKTIPYRFEKMNRSLEDDIVIAEVWL